MTNETFPEPEDQQDLDAQEVEKKDDPIALYILDMIAGGAQVSPRDVAIQISKDRAKASDRPDQWRKFLLAVKQQAVFLARQGRIHILRKGKPVNPNNFRGLVKLSLPLEGYDLQELLNSSDDDLL